MKGAIVAWEGRGPEPRVHGLGCEGRRHRSQATALHTGVGSAGRRQPGQAPHSASPRPGRPGFGHLGSETRLWGLHNGQAPADARRRGQEGPHLDRAGLQSLLGGMGQRDTGPEGPEGWRAGSGPCEAGPRENAGREGAALG